MATKGLVDTNFTALSQFVDPAKEAGSFFKSYADRVRADEQTALQNKLALAQDSRQEQEAKRLQTTFDQAQQEKTNRLLLQQSLPSLLSNSNANTTTTNAVVTDNNTNSNNTNSNGQPLLSDNTPTQQSTPILNSANSTQQPVDQTTNGSLLQAANNNIINSVKPNIPIDNNTTSTNTNDTRLSNVYTAPTDNQDKKLFQAYETQQNKQNQKTMLSDIATVNNIDLNGAKTIQEAKSAIPNSVSPVDKNTGISLTNTLVDPSSINMKDPVTKQMFTSIAPTLNKIDDTLNALGNKEKQDNDTHKEFIGKFMAKAADLGVVVNPTEVSSFADLYAPTFKMSEIDKEKIAQLRTNIKDNIEIIKAGNEDERKRALEKIEQFKAETDSIYKKAMVKVAQGELKVKQGELQLKKDEASKKDSFKEETYTYTRDGKTYQFTGKTQDQLNKAAANFGDKDSNGNLIIDPNTGLPKNFSIGTHVNMPKDTNKITPDTFSNAGNGMYNKYDTYATYMSYRNDPDYAKVPNEVLASAVNQEVSNGIFTDRVRKDVVDQSLKDSGYTLGNKKNKK